MVGRSGNGSGNRSGEGLRSGGSVRVLRRGEADERDPLWRRGGSYFYSLDVRSEAIA